jgi:hypothetical protein
VIAAILLCIVVSVILAFQPVVLLLVVNIAVYTVGLFVADTLLELGDFAGSRENDLLNYDSTQIPRMAGLHNSVHQKE